MDITTLHPETKIAQVMLRLVPNSPITHCLSTAAESCRQGKRKEIHKQHDFLSKSTRPPTTPVSMIEFKENWIRLVNSAQAYWWKLSKKDLGNTNGQEQKLVNLVRQRYLIGNLEATQQVKRFFQQTKTELG